MSFQSDIKYQKGISCKSLTVPAAVILIETEQREIQPLPYGGKVFRGEISQKTCPEKTNGYFMIKT